MNHEHTPPGGVPSGRDLDRMLAFIDGELPRAEAEHLLSELQPADRARLLAMSGDSHALRAMHAPDAPDGMHEAIMAAAERSELLGGHTGVPRAAAWCTSALDGAPGVVARPWAVRWRSVGSMAAMLTVAAGVAWFAWPRANSPQAVLPAPNGAGVVHATYMPITAPFALVLEFDDFDNADATLRSAAQDANARVTCVCPSHCSTLVDGPPHIVGADGDRAELMAVADCPTHTVSVPVNDFPLVLSTLLGAGNGAIAAPRFGAEFWNLPTSGTVELPVFIVPSNR